MWRLYAWEKAVILSTTESLWFESALGLAKQLGAAGIEVLKPSAFETGSFNAAILREIKRSTIRIVMLCAYDPDMLEIASKADTEGMTSVGWAWVLTEGIVANLPERIQGWLYIQPLLPSKGMQAFAEQVSEYSKSRFNIPVDADSIDLTYSQTLYDAVMLYAHAATKVLSDGGDLRDGQAVTAAVRSTTFEGVGGSAVALDENGDRVESYEIMNYVVGADSAISGVPVGKYDSTERQYTAYERAVVWPGSTMEVPKDMEDIRREDCLAGTFYSEEMLACGATAYLSRPALTPSFLFPSLPRRSITVCGRKLPAGILQQPTWQPRVLKLRGPGTWSSCIV